jgi:hypothetical protein
MLESRNLARHQARFDDVLYSHLARTPWWLVSLAFHGLVVLILFHTPFGQDPYEVTRQSRTQLQDDFLDPVEPLVKPDIRELPPIDQEEEALDEPTIKDAKLSDHNETDNDRPTEESLGELDMMSDSPLEGPSTNAEIGIGPAAGGPFGGRGGHRNLRAWSDSHITEKSVRLGLEWLVDHQDPDGMWDCDGFMARCELAACGGPGYALYDPGVSGLALLAFLGAGHTHKHGAYRDTVKRGLRYLKGIQDPEGCFGPRTEGHFTYNHAIGALTMAEAYAMTGSPLFKESAQRGIDFVHKCQNPYLAWRYGVRPGENDTSVTGWMVMALKSAKVAGLVVDRAAFDGARAWLDKVTEPEYGRAGYTRRGDGPARKPDMLERFPPDRSESMTAVGILSRVFVGENPRESEVIGKGVDLCLRSLPVWDEGSGAIDMYYWYYGTLALFQVGGEPWRQWNAAIKDAIVDHQRNDGCEKGSWDPVGVWGREGGRVYATALNTLCMELYYRYA